MDDNKKLRNLWLFSGSCFIISAITHLMSRDGKWYITIIHLITATLMFFNAYNFHKKDRNK